MAQTCRPHPPVNRKAACTFLTKQNIMKNKLFLLYGLAALAAALFQLALLHTAQSSVLVQAAL